MQTKHTLAVVSVAAAGLLGLLWVWLPPLQTADVAGIVASVVAHIIVTLTADRLLHGKRPIYTVVGIGTTAVLYWLTAVGVAVVWRLLRLSNILLLATVEVVLALVFVAFGWLFEVAGRRMGVEEHGMGTTEQASSRLD